MGFSTESALDHYVEELEEDRQPDGFWHPSSISGCLRQAVYEYTGTTKTNPPDLRAKRVFRVGHVFHEFVQAAIPRHPDVLAFQPEVGFIHEPKRIKGHSDGLLWFKSGAVEVLELKTINSMSFKFNDLPKPAHVSQVSIYMKALREGNPILPDGTILPPFGETLKRARVIYISKDDLRIEEHTVHFTEAKDRAIDERLRVLEESLATDTLPDRLPLVPDKKKGGLKPDYLCGYCPFQTLCWRAAPFAP